MKHRLELLSTVPIEIIWHENRSTYLSVKKEGSRITLRVHRLFYEAPTPVLEALLRYAVGRDRQSKAIIRQMAHLHFSKTTAEPKNLESAGEVYDLKEILNRMQKLLPLQGLSIGWSDRTVRGRFRSVTFGTYDQLARQIRINRLLDDSQVPLYFLEFIVYHEMLHDVCPSHIDATGRCFVHTREFRKRERQFPQFAEAKKWEKGSLTFFKMRKYRGRP